MKNRTIMKCSEVFYDSSFTILNKYRLSGFVNGLFKKDQFSCKQAVQQKIQCIEEVLISCAK